MESRRWETEATVHTVGGELESCLSDVQLLIFDWVFFRFHLTFHESSLLDEVSENVREDRVSGCCISGRYLHFIINIIESSFDLILLHNSWIYFLLLNFWSIKVLGVFSINCGETEIILLNERWIQRVEIKHHNNIIIESWFWFKNQSTTVLSLLSFAFASFYFRCVFISNQFKLNMNYCW